MKKIARIIAPPPAHFVGDGFRVHNFIPGMFGGDMYRTDPFILMDYNSKYHFPPSNQPRGVGVHPHRGFETVTIAYKGRVAHADSSGGGGIIGEGDVQWMTAASGVLHKEYHEEEFSRNGGEFQMVQLWVNLPAAEKMSSPKYQAISKADMGHFKLDENGGFIEVIAGNYRGVPGPASTFTTIEMYNARMKDGSVAEFSFPASHNTVLLVVEGEIRVNDGKTVPTDHMVSFENSGERIILHANTDAVVLVLSGEPIGEPIAARGPFVMNSTAELYQAIDDYNMGRFGYLED